MESEFNIAEKVRKTVYRGRENGKGEEERRVGVSKFLFPEASQELDRFVIFPSLRFDRCHTAGSLLNNSTD